MAYKWATKSTGTDDDWFEGNTVVVVATGSHDCSRLIQALRSGNSEQSRLGEQIARSLNRRPLGRRVAELLKRHGGEDLTELATHDELKDALLRLDDLIGHWAECPAPPDARCETCWDFVHTRKLLREALL